MKEDKSKREKTVSIIFAVLDALIVCFFIFMLIF